MQDKPVETNRYPDVTGVILAGGQSSRMGRDKATLEVEGASLFARTLAILQDFFPAVIIAGDRPDLSRADVPYYPDIYPGSALGGLYTGLLRAQTDWIFVAPCDMPHLDATIIRALLKHRNGSQAVVPRTGRGYEPLFALYHKECLPGMETMLKKRLYRVDDLYARIAVRYLDEPHLPQGWEKALSNVNTPEEYAKLRKEHE